MTSKFSLLALSAALFASVAFPALSSATLPSAAVTGAAVIAVPGASGAPLILVDHDDDDHDDDDHDDDDHDEGHRSKGLLSFLGFGDDDDDDCDDEKHWGDDDDDGRDGGCGASTNAVPAGSVTPPDNGLFAPGAAPTANSN